jgi:membrane-bound ClpP family serine protease
MAVEQNVPQPFCVLRAPLPHQEKPSHAAQTAGAGLLVSMQLCMANQTKIGDCEVVIMRIDEGSDDEHENYVSIEDEATLDKIFEIFKSKFKDEFNFCD